MAVRIVTDSASDFPPELAGQHGVAVVPAYVIMGDDSTYKDRVELTADEFYRQLGAAARLPSTAQPSAADFQQTYEEILAQGDQIVSIHISSKLSGTVNSALQAKAALGDDAPIEVVDSYLASLPLTLLALDAATKGAGDYRELAARVRRVMGNYYAFVMVDTLEYLQKGGRIGKAQAFFGSMLSVKPILSLADGVVVPVERPRSRDRGLRRLVELARNLPNLRQVMVAHSTEPAATESVTAGLRDAVGAGGLVAGRFGPVLGVYLGPNAVGIGASCGDF